MKVSEMYQRLKKEILKEFEVAKIPLENTIAVSVILGTLGTDIDIWFFCEPDNGQKTVVEVSLLCGFQRDFTREEMIWLSVDRFLFENKVEDVRGLNKPKRGD